VGTPRYFAKNYMQANHHDLLSGQQLSYAFSIVCMDGAQLGIKKIATVMEAILDSSGGAKNSIACLVL
jgi:hypothetical protein